MNVSIVIPAFNYGKYISDAVDSCLMQSVPPHEIIVVDDGSTDDTWDILGTYGGKIRAIRQANSGSVLACRAGIALATGDVVIILDADDVLEKDAVALHSRVMEDSSVVVSQGGMRIMDKQGALIKSNYFSGPWLTGDLSPFILREGRLPKNVYTSGNAWRRSVVLGMLERRPKIRNAIDGYLHTVMPLAGLYADTGGIVARYRVHGANEGTMATASVQHLSAKANDEAEKLLHATSILNERNGAGAKLLAAEFPDRSLKVMRNFVAWKYLGAAMPASMGKVSWWRAFRAWWNCRGQRNWLKNGIWLGLLALPLPSGYVRKLCLPVVSQMPI
jgi:glycosyltransferase involved in cell wall biosynthesis